MRESEIDFKIGDDWETDHSANRPDALAKFYRDAMKITMEFEHMIDNDNETVDINDVDAVSKGKSKLRSLTYFDFQGIRTDRWGNEFLDTFEYTFKNEVIGLLEALGFDVDEFEL